MAFRLYRPGGKADIEYYQAADNVSFSEGETVIQTGGKLGRSGATVTPEFITQAAVAAATPGAMVPVVRVTEEQEWKTKSNGTVTATLKGSKVTVSGDGTECTATTTNGVFLITQTDETVGGGNVVGMFRR